MTNNKSTLTAKVYLINDWSLSINGRTNNTMTIDGTKQTFSSPSISSKGTHLLGTLTQTVNHAGDGSKSLTISVVFHIEATLSGVYYSTITASANIALDSIPRASSISMSTGTLGSAATITISRASSSFTHTITYKFGSATGTIVSKTSETSVSWTPALTLGNQIPNTTSGTATLTCTTYNGSTSIGSKSINVKLSIPASVVPTITSLTATRVDGDVPSAWGIYVQTKSKATLTINGASGSYGSAITSYSITGGGFAGTSNTMTTGFLNAAGTITFTATVTDSRGRTSAAKTVSISVTDTVSTAAVIMDFKSGGTGIAVGKVSERNHCFEVASDWSVRLNGTTYLGTSTLGGTAKPIYLNGGVPTVCSSTVGGIQKPVYMNSGSITACSGTVGSVSTPVYMSGGTITACTPASIISGVCADYVVESGKSGIWTYRKWNSGIAECWGIYSASGVNLTASYYSGFYYSASISVNLPFTFAAAPVGTYSGGCTSYITFVTPTGQPTTTQARFWIACLDASAKSCSVSVGMMIRGRWK